MPRLEACLVGLPASALYGQVVGLTLEVRNTGSLPAAMLRLATSHPTFFFAGDGPAPDLAGEAERWEDQV